MCVCAGGMGGGGMGGNMGMGGKGGGGWGMGQGGGGKGGKDDGYNFGDYTGGYSVSIQIQIQCSGLRNKIYGQRTDMF